MVKKLLGRARAERQGGVFLLILVLAVLSACAPAKKVELEPELQVSSVERYQDGRHGFIIREVATMDGQSRQDFQTAVSLLEEENYDKAIELLEKVIAASPGVTAPYVNIAMAYSQSDKKDKVKKAEEHLKAALDLFPAHPVVSNEYGLLLRKNGRFSEAREIFEKALGRFPEYLPGHRNLGILCDLYLNDLACALEHYEIFHKARPEDEQVKIWIADVSMRLGR